MRSVFEITLPKDWAEPPRYAISLFDGGGPCSRTKRLKARAQRKKMKKHHKKNR